MLNKYKILNRIGESGLVAVVRAESAEQAKHITKACIDGGCAAVEITFTVPFAHRIIENLAQTYSDDEIILGAGTVLDPETARIAILSGAKYIVSSSFNVDTAKLCNRYAVPYMPGCMSLMEITSAIEYGVDVVKIFPGDILTVNFIKDVKGPMPQVNMMPSGGVDVSNAGDWIKAGCFALGAGSSLIGGAKKGDYNKITQTAKDFRSEIRKARGLGDRNV